MKRWFENPSIMLGGEFDYQMGECSIQDRLDEGFLVVTPYKTTYGMVGNSYDTFDTEEDAISYVNSLGFTREQL